MADNFGLKIGVEGEKEFKNALRDINQSFKVLVSEMNLVSSQFDKNDKSLESLTAKNETLNKSIDTQRDKVSTLEKALSNAATSFGENDKRTQAWQIQLNNANAQLNDMQKELDQNNKSLDGVSKEFNTAESQVDQFGNEVKNTADKADHAGSRFEKLGGVVKGIGISMGIAFAAIGTAAVSAGKALTYMTVGAAEYADEILTMSTVTGMSTDQLQAYKYAAELVDVSMETLTGSMSKQIKSMSNARDGSTKFADAYAKLGISVADSNGQLRDSDTVYWETIDALGKISNETERDALAMQIFGKSAQELNPLIAQGSAGIAELTEEAKQMGVVMGEDSLNALGAFDDSMQRLKGGAEGAKNALGMVLLPQLQLLANDGVILLGEFTKGLNDAGGDWGKISDDRVGNRIKEQEKSSSKVLLEISNVFNKADRLVESKNTANWETKRTTYDYDKNGNMVKKNMPYNSYMTYKYDNENRLTAIRDKQNLLFAALYDGNGDRIFTVATKYDTGGWHDNGNNGGWQEKNTSKNYGSTSQTTEKVDISSQFKVDYNKKLVDNTMLIPNGVNQWGKEQYELTGYINNVNTKNTQVLMEYGFDGKIGNSYDYGLDRNSIISKSKKNYYAYDGRGSATELLNSQGNVSMGYSYGAFGKTTTTTNLNVDNPYQYNAEYVDDIPGVPDLQYLRARYYSPYEGRFFSQDTIFGDMMAPLSQNLYVYCHNNPMMFTDPSGRYEIPLFIKMAGPAAIASYEAGMKKYDPVNIAKKSIAAKAQKAAAANNPSNPTNGSNNASSIEYQASQSSSANNSSSYTSTYSSPSTDFGQADAMRRAEEARAIEKIKRDLNNKACTSLVNGQKYAQELAEIYQKEHEVEKIQKFLNTSNPAMMLIVINDDILSLLTQDQKIDMILLSNEKNKINSPLNSDYIGLTKNDLRGQGIEVVDGSTDAMLTFYNFMYKTSKFGITLSDAEYYQQAKKRAELEASMFAMLMASNLTGNMNNNTKVNTWVFCVLMLLIYPRILIFYISVRISRRISSRRCWIHNSYIRYLPISTTTTTSISEPCSFSCWVHYIGRPRCTFGYYSLALMERLATAMTMA